MTETKWVPFTFYYGRLTGYRNEAGVELIPTNGRAGWWDVFEDGEWVGESFPNLAEAKAWVG